jgi:hypothetical protein
VQSDVVASVVVVLVVVVAAAAVAVNVDVAVYAIVIKILGEYTHYLINIRNNLPVH